MSRAARAVLAVLDLLVFAACAYVAQWSYRQLFVDIPRVHFATWQGRWDMPKTAAFVMLTAAAAGAIAALLLLLPLRTRGAWWAARAIEIGSLLTVAGAAVVWKLDFLSNAGSFG